MGPPEVEDPERQGEELQEVRQQEVEDVDQLAATPAWAAQVVQSPEGQQVAGEPQGEDDPIDARQAEDVRVQREVAAVVGHLSGLWGPPRGDRKKAKGLRVENVSVHF